jgi:hypothetical protein
VHWRVRVTASDQTSKPREKRGLRVWQLSWIIIAAAAVSGELAIQFAHPQHEQMEQLAAPVVNVPAFHVLSAADVRPLWWPAARVPADAVRSANDVVGRVTMTSLTANRPITAAELGPAAAARHGTLSVVGVPATGAMALDGALTSGQSAEVIVNGRARDPGHVSVLVLSVTRSGTGNRPYVVLVAIPARTPRSVIAAMGAGNVTLVGG